MTQSSFAIAGKEMTRPQASLSRGVALGLAAVTLTLSGCANIINCKEAPPGGIHTECTVALGMKAAPVEGVTEALASIPVVGNALAGGITKSALGNRMHYDEQAGVIVFNPVNPHWDTNFCGGGLQDINGVPQWVGKTNCAPYPMPGPTAVTGGERPNITLRADNGAKLIVLDPKNGDQQGAVIIAQHPNGAYGTQTLFVNGAPVAAQPCPPQHIQAVREERVLAGDYKNANTCLKL